MSGKARGWYAVHTYSGSESKVKKSIELRIIELNMSDHIFRVVIPTAKYTEVRGGQAYVAQRRLFPGYVLVEMLVDRESCDLVQNTPGVNSLEKLGGPINWEELDFGG